jgi:hypothetical protein
MNLNINDHDNDQDAFDAFLPAPYFDHSFQTIFIDHSEESIELQSYSELLMKIATYSIDNSTRLRVTKSSSTIGYHQYKCASHRNCPFKAMFGQRGVENRIILKQATLHHSGVPLNERSDGRSFRRRL